MTYLEMPDHIPLYYEERGEGETILLVHGWSCNGGYWWQKNVESLSESYHVVTVDLRGHGQSGKTDHNHTLSQYAQDIRHLMESLNLTDVTLVGWSMGTAIALSYFDQFGSDRLRSFVFVDMSPYMFSEEGWEYPLFGEFTPEALDGVVEALQNDRPSFVKEQILEAFFVERPSEDVIDEMYAEMMKTPTGVTVAAFQAFCDNDFRDVVGKIDIPTLLVYAEGSAIFPGDVGAWMHEQIPDSELVVFENSSHCPFWEEPERFNHELATFVAGLKDRMIGAP